MPYARQVCRAYTSRGGLLRRYFSTWYKTPGQCSVGMQVPFSMFVDVASLIKSIWSSHRLILLPVCGFDLYVDLRRYARTKKNIYYCYRMVEVLVLMPPICM